MKSINLGIIGLGYWGPNYARIITELDANLIWCCDINESALRKFSKLYPGVKTSNNINDLLNDEILQAVIIVTPAQDHFEIASKFLKAGKDVLIEKPMTRKLEDAQELLNLSKAHKRVLMVDHTFEFNPAIRKLKQYINELKFGKIFYIYGNYNALGPIRKDVSVLWDLPHFIYVVNYLLGSSPIWVRAEGKDFLQKKMADVAFLNFEYPGDILFNFHCSWIDPVKVRRLVIVGQKKMAVFDDMAPEAKLVIYDKGVQVSSDPNFANLQLQLRYGDTIIPKLETSEPLKEVVKAFIKSVLAGKTLLSTAQEGLDLVTILTAAQKSLDQSGRKIWLKK